MAVAQAQTDIRQIAAMVAALLIGSWTVELTAQCTPDWATGAEIPPGLNGGVYATVVYDDGSGPATYVGGYFTMAGTTTVNRIAKWNGTTWSPLVVGAHVGLNGGIQALEVVDMDGPGGAPPTLFAAGDFTTAGGVAANRVARWDPTIPTWVPLGTGIPGGNVRALAGYDPDDAGPEPMQLYVGGSFQTAGGVSSLGIARWSGNAWSKLTMHSNAGLWVDLTDPCWCPAPPMPPPNCGCEVSVGGGSCGALEVFNDGGGPKLYIGGNFGRYASISSANLVRYDGTTISANPIGLPPNNFSPVHLIWAMKVFDPDGAVGPVAPGLYVAGTLPSGNIQRWDGSTFTALGSGTNGIVRSLEPFDADPAHAGPALLCAGGDFTTAGGGAASRIAFWNGATWAPLGSGLTGGTTSVRTLASFDADGAGANPPQLMTGGTFTSAGGQSAGNLSSYGCEPAPLTGACCLPAGECQLKSSAECTAIVGATYRGDGTTCPPSPVCGGEGDANGDSVIDGSDIDCFVRCRFGINIAGCNCTAADIDGDGDVDGQDHEAFLCILMELWPSCP